jgi:tripartite-type tricarboxylate transporter receptor subunit TctC
MSVRRENPAGIGRRLFISASAAGMVSAPAIVSAQNGWPTRQIRVVVPYPPGGPSDITTRIVMERAGSLLGQSVLFDNKAGARRGQRRHVKRSTRTATPS